MISEMQKKMTAADSVCDARMGATRTSPHHGNSHERNFVLVEGESRKIAAKAKFPEKPVDENGQRAWHGVTGRSSVFGQHIACVFVPFLARDFRV